jgi:parallel beta-helix repeat protein
MKRTSVAAVVGVVLVSMFLPAPSEAVVLNCGDTITEDTTLTADVVCPTGGVGVYIGASDVTLRLNGHTVRTAPGVIGDYGVITSAPLGLEGVEVQGGTISGFATGVALEARYSLVARLKIDARDAGISLVNTFDPATATPRSTLCEPSYPANNCVYRNVVNVGGGAFPGLGIDLYGARSHAWGNTVAGTVDTGILASGDKPRIVLNRVDCCMKHGISVGSFETAAMVHGNVLVHTGSAGDSTGIETQNLGYGGSVAVRANSATGFAYGLWLTTAGVLVGNNANGNAAYGIYVTGTNVNIRDNTANDNQIGFSVADGNTNGGGNRATGNDVDCEGDGFCPVLP